MPADCLSEVFEIWETDTAVTRFVKYFTADVVNIHRAKEQASKVNDDPLRQGKNLVCYESRNFLQIETGIKTKTLSGKAEK